MPTLKDRSVSELLSNPLSHARLRDWKERHDPGGVAVDRWIFGEIYWERQIGRPTTDHLCEGFWISISHEYWMPASLGPGEYHYERKSWDDTPRLHLWNGKDDSEHFRVVFAVDHIPPGETVDKNPEHYLYTHVYPTLKNVPWNLSIDKTGMPALSLRGLHPTRSDFVKAVGPDFLSFRVTSEDRTIVGVREP